MSITSPQTSSGSRAPSVLVFDSGVGGLSILQEIHRKIPQCQLVYACDNQAFPYGTKDESDLVDRVDAVLKALIHAIAPDIVVVACNTASTVALPKIRAHFHKPVVGVVPAIKPASALTQTKVIGLLATPGTVNRRYTEQLIQEFANNCTVIKVGSSELVMVAEQKLQGVTPDPQMLQELIAPLFANPLMDTLVLACTHFPLLRDELAAAAPRQVHWVDSGEAIARRVHALLHPDLPPPVEHQVQAPMFACWLTAQDEKLAQGLIRAGACSLQVITL